MLAISILLLALTGRSAIAEHCGSKEHCLKHEHYVVDDVDCHRTCGNRLIPGQATAGACVPYTGCACDDGYVRSYDNATGPCIPVHKCAQIPKKCGVNEEPSSCAIDCPPQTCESIYTSYLCPKNECKPGCNCKNNYLRDSNGVCILSDNCGAGGETKKCNGDKNAVYKECPSPCPPTCEDPNPRICTKLCLKEGCECKPGHLLSKIGGKCIKPEQCPATPPPPQCRPNEVLSECAKGCPPQSCESLYVNYLCAEESCTVGCVCESGYLRNSAGKCIPSKHCPKDPNAPIFLPSYSQSGFSSSHSHSSSSNSRSYSASSSSSSSTSITHSGAKKCNGDKNAVYKECPSPCPPTCEDPNPRICTKLCLKEGCECKPGHLLSKIGGKCIKPEQCPGSTQCQGNATYVECRSACPATCADQGDKVCLEAGCECSAGYVLNDAGACVLPEDCPDKCKSQNATFSSCPGACPATCAKPETNQVCIKKCLEPGCVCDQGYVLTEKGGECIRPEDCPGGSPTCSKNETYTYCKVGCPTNYCPVDDSRAIIACDPPYPCPSGCVCKVDHLRLSEQDPRCVLASDCPAVNCTRQHEEWNPQPFSCRVETCYDLASPSECNKPYLYDNPACVCEQGYYRNNDGICVSGSECLECEKHNATFSECRTACPATCANPDANNKACIRICKPPGCACNPGYVLNEPDGQCILPQDCPGKCDDPNASYSNCTSACPATCGDTGDKACIAMCMPPGCECNPGYVRSEAGGKCVLPENCPVDCENRNATFSECRSACPATCADPDTDNKPCILICRPPGCACKPGYVLTEPDGQCILPQDCPVQCDYPNATYSGCTGACPETCEDTGDKAYIAMCIEPGKCDDPNASYSNCTSACPATCGDTGDKACIAMCMPPGCECNPGYVRSEAGGKCVLPKNCPVNEDYCTAHNATYKECRSACPGRCSTINSGKIYCPTVCREPGCECNAGYVLDDNDRCILPEDCPGEQLAMLFVLYISVIYLSDRVLGYVDKNKATPALQCGHNETAVECRTICPPQNCEIAYTEYACGESRCEPGCDCLPNYLRNGSGICILNDDCPYPSYPICGINEIARDCKRICPPQTCQSKLALYRCMENIPCESGCDCVANYLRDDNGVCIPSEECFATPTCSVPPECRRTCASPNPPNCPYEPAETNIDGCNCQDGYILSQEGTCIKIEDCPIDVGCNGDPHAKAKQCPKPCPSTCSTPNGVDCKRKCNPIGCACTGGYIFSEEQGKCILPEECPGGNPCGSNGRFVECKNGCPTDYCPVDDSRAIVACDPVPIQYCSSGCICDLNHKKLSRGNETCVVSSTCPPVKCTRQNEVWSTCPECLAEMCSDANNPPSVCNTLVLNCQPKCICKKNHFRNSKDLCVTRKECGKFLSDSL